MKEVIILKYKTKILFILLIFAFALSLNAADAEFVFNDEPFIFKGQTFIPGQKYTRESIEKKLGKPDYYENAPGGWTISYDGKIIFIFNRVNSFSGFIFNHIEKTKGLDIYGLHLSKDDSYPTIYKKLKDLKKKFNTEFVYESDSIHIKASLKDKFGDVKLIIRCSNSGKQEIISISLWQPN